jgi:hypothetical protein
VFGENPAHLVFVHLDPKYFGDLVRDPRTAESRVARLDLNDDVDELGRGTWRSGVSTAGMRPKELAVLAPHQGAVDAQEG